MFRDRFLFESFMLHSLLFGKIYIAWDSLQVIFGIRERAHSGILINSIGEHAFLHLLSVLCMTLRTSWNLVSPSLSNYRSVFVFNVADCRVHDVRFLHDFSCQVLFIENSVHNFLIYIGSDSLKSLMDIFVNLFKSFRANFTDTIDFAVSLTLFPDVVSERRPNLLIDLHVFLLGEFMLFEEIFVVNMLDMLMNE